MSEPSTSPGADQNPGRRSFLWLAAGVMAMIAAVVFVGLKSGGDGQPPPDGDRLLAEGRIDEAIAAYRAAIAADARSVEAHRGYQNAMRRAKREGEAAAEYDRLAKASPGDVLFVYLAARIAPSDEERLAGMMRALKLSPDFLPARRSVGVMAAERRDFATAVPHLEACARSREATHDDLLTLLAIVHQQIDIARAGEWMHRWWELPRPGPGQKRAVVLAREGAKRSVELQLEEQGCYLLVIFVEGRGKRWIGVKRDGAKWAVAEARGWTPVDQAEDPNAALRDAVGTLDREPAYVEVLERAMSCYREEEKPH